MLLGKDLYRALLREAKALPDSASSSHYRNRIQASFRRDPVPESSLAAVKRTKEAQQLLRQLQAANDGYLHSLTRVLETTYGQRGPKKHALLRPFLDPPTTPRTSRQSFSAPLSALLTSQISHVARPPSAANLLSPPSLPPRAFPTSEDARLLGPLTAQRVKKIKLRYWNDQTGKLRAPIAVVVRREGEELSLEESTEVLERLGLGGVRLEEGRKVLEDLERKARVGEVPRKPRRLQSRAERATKGPTVKQGEGGKERKELRILSPSSKNSKWHLPKTLSPRLLRRRYQAILHDSPILVISESSSPPPRPSSKKPSSTSPPIPQPSDPTASPTKTTTFVVRRSDGAKGGTAGMGIFSEEDRWWLAQDEVMFGRSKESKSRRGGREKR